MNIYYQCKVFCIFVLLGILICFLFDIFRGLRRSFTFSNITVIIQDLLFLIISGIIFLYGLISFNNGEIRFFILLALVFGIVIYVLTISKHCVIIVTVIFQIFKRIFEMVYKLVISIFSLFIMPFKLIKKAFKHLKNTKNKRKLFENKKSGEK